MKKTSLTEYKHLHKKGQSKFRNDPCIFSGIIEDGESINIKFDSKKERTRFMELLSLKQAGYISQLELQPKFIIKPKTDKSGQIVYIADFKYMEKGIEIIEDVKSEITRKNRTYINKIKFLKDQLRDDQEFREVV